MPFKWLTEIDLSALFSMFPFDIAFCIIGCIALIIVLGIKRIFLQ